MTAILRSTAAILKSSPQSETAKGVWSALIFALKTFVAGLLALYVAFRLGLDEPRWALLTVYIVSQPESGLVLAKSFYRALGTAAGILFSILLVFTFGQYGGLFLPSLALWTGICNFAARAVRNFTSYGFLLAGYTAALISIPAALNPNQAYSVVVARGTEVAIGIAFAALASQILFPRALMQRLVAVTRQVIVRVRQFGFAALDPATDRAAFAAQRIQLIQDLASIDSLRASAYFESAPSDPLTGPIRQVTQAALTICAIANDVLGRATSASHFSISSPWIASTLLSKNNDTPAERAAVGSMLISISDQRDILDAEADLTHAEDRLEGKSNAVPATAPLHTWSDPISALLTGIRTALAVGVTWATWFVTAWPSGPTAIIVATVVCSLIASMEQPVTITLVLAVTILVASVPVFVTVFCLLPLADDFASMAFMLAPLLLMCGFVIAQPKIGALGLLTVVYFDVGSNIDNVMHYDAIEFFNTSLAVLFGIGVALVLFATFFPQTPSQALRSLRNQLCFQLSRFSAGHGDTWASFAYGVFDQLATNFVRVKDEPGIAREYCAMAMAALSTAFAINRLKRSLNAPLPFRVNHEIEMLLGRVSETLARPSRAGLLTRAWEARKTRVRILNDARQSNTIWQSRALGRVFVGCESLRANLLKVRVLSKEGRHVW
jgi:uncharacterized membrane protein YccC